MEDFNLNDFSSNLNEAIKYIRISKSICMDDRFRIETNKNDEIVKVYVISNNQIKTVSHFNNGKLIKECHGGTRNG